MCQLYIPKRFWLLKASLCLIQMPCTTDGDKCLLCVTLMETSCFIKRNKVFPVLKQNVSILETNLEHIDNQLIIRFSFLITTMLSNNYV